MIALGDPELALQYKQTEQTISALLDELSAKERKIIRARFGFDGEPKTLQELGDEVGNHRERVRQIEARAIRKLKHPSRSLRLRQASPQYWAKEDAPPPKPPTLDPLAEELHRLNAKLRWEKEGRRILALQEIAHRAQYPEYAVWLEGLRGESRLPEAGPWSYWDFRWPFEAGMSPAEAVDFAIKFNACPDQRAREHLCECVREMSK